MARLDSSLLGDEAIIKCRHRFARSTWVSVLPTYIPKINREVLGFEVGGGERVAVNDGGDRGISTVAHVGHDAGASTRLSGESR